MSLHEFLVGLTGLDMMLIVFISTAFWLPWGVIKWWAS